MKTLVIAFLLMLCSTASFAATAVKSFPLAISGRLEHVWSKLDRPVFSKDEVDNYGTEIQGSVLGSIKFRPNVYFTGRYTHGFETKGHDIAVGVEARIY